MNKTKRRFILGFGDEPGYAVWGNQDLCGSRLLSQGMTVPMTSMEARKLFRFFKKQELDPVIYELVEVQP